MKANIIYALRELGIDITDVQYKYPTSRERGCRRRDIVLKGVFVEELDVERLVDEIFILRSIAKNKNPAVKDLYEKLRTVAGIASE